MKRQLVEWGQQKEAQFVVERELRERELEHDNTIKELETRAKIDHLKEAQLLEQASEDKMQTVGFSHTEKINEKQLAFDLKEHEKKQ